MMPPFHAERTGDILIVDDVPENLQLLFEILSEEGHEVRRVLNGQQALKVIEVDPPDLVLLDIKMPIMDGYEVCTHLKADQKTAQIPIIFLSALNDVLDKAKAFSVGGVDYINKPFDVYEVLVRVDNQLKLLQATKALAERNRELAQLNEDLEAFNYMVSHDLRRPLTQLLGFSEFLLDDDFPEEELQETVEIIRQSGRDMNQTLTDLMRLATIQREPLHLETFNLSEIATEVSNNLLTKEPERDVVFSIDSELMVVGDRNLLKLALENLIENALKYSGHEKQTHISFSQLETGEFCIRDNGIGFDMADTKDLFEPFKRLHDRSDFAGTGIGLAIVKRIIKSHHGTIWCDATVGEGASFFFTLDPDLANKKSFATKTKDS